MSMNSETFKKQFLPYHGKLYRIAYRFLQDTEDAEDIVQEAYIRLWSKRDSLELLENAEAFAIIIVRNMCLDFLRKNKREFHPYDLEMPDRECFTKQMEIEDQIRQVESIMDSFPKQQRMVMLLKHWDGFSDEEIEQITGLSRANIKMIISRARKKIRERFIK